MPTGTKFEYGAKAGIEPRLMKSAWRANSSAAHRRDQYGRIGRLGQIAVRARLESLRHVRGLYERGRQMHHGQLRGAAARAQLPADLESVHVGQVDIEHQQDPRASAASSAAAPVVASMTSKPAERSTREVAYSDAGLSSTTSIFCSRPASSDLAELIWSWRDPAAPITAGIAHPEARPFAQLAVGTARGRRAARRTCAPATAPVRCRAGAVAVRVSICTKSENSVGRCSLRDADAGVGHGKLDHSVRLVCVRSTRTSPSLVNFSALEMKLRSICDSFLSSV